MISKNESIIFFLSNDQTTLNKRLIFQLAIVIIPLISSLGVITNLVNIMVFLNPKLKDQSFYYLLAYSCNDFVYLCISTINFYSFCDNICSLNDTLAYQVIKLFLISYFTSCLAICSILIEIFISFQRFFIFINKLMSKNISYKKVLTAIYLISFIYYSSMIILKNIVTNKSETKATFSNKTY